MDTIREILKDINTDINEALKHKSNNYFRNFMEIAFLPEKQLPLPEGNPPYTPNSIESEVQTKGVVWQFLKKVPTLLNPKLNALRREVMYIDALESVTKEEAVLFLHMKDQTVSELYPNITLDNLRKIGYF